MPCSVEKTLPVAWLDNKLNLLYSAMAEARTYDLPKRNCLRNYINASIATVSTVYFVNAYRNVCDRRDNT